MSSELHAVLVRTDMSHPSITSGASAMMSLYDTAAPTAVNEWRNALQVCHQDQLLPLLYVANEVLQNSKRNRGNKFLEAFSNVLAQSLEYICTRAPQLTEKVRRTAKIWGDRRVYSVRFVGELLKRLEPYRNRTEPVEPEPEPEVQVSFSPTVEEAQAKEKEEQEKTSEAPAPEVKAEDSADAAPTADDLMRPSSDDESLDFGGGDAQLDIQVDASQLTDETMASKQPVSKRRRRSSSIKKRRKATTLSTQTLQDLVSQLSSLEQSLDRSTTLIQGIPTKANQDYSELVGEELLDAYQRNQAHAKVLQQEKANLYRIANQKHALEQEALRYIPWLRSALMQDEEDLQICDVVEQQLLELKTIHGPAKRERERRREKEELARTQQALEQQLKKDEEERRQLLAAAMARQDEAQPGMVWDKRRQEYVYLNTDESWRD